MIVSPDTKLTGDYWDEEMGLYLDVAAEVQLFPLWWRQFPNLYALLQARRAEKGIAVQDALDIGPDDLDGLMDNKEILGSYDDE